MRTVSLENESLSANNSLEDTKQLTPPQKVDLLENDELSHQPQLQEPVSHFTIAQQQELRQIAKEVAVDLLKKNPELLVQTIQTYGEDQQKKAMAAEMKRVSGFRDQLTDDKSAFVLGKGDGRLKMVAFVDPNCPHCNTFEENVNDIKSKFNELKIYIRPWAILGKPSEEVVKSFGYLKQHAPEKYEAISKAISASLAQGNHVDGNAFIDIAKKNGVDVKKLQNTSYKAEADKFISINKDLASEGKLALGGTPAVFLFDDNDVQIVTDIRKEGLMKTLKKAIEKKEAGPQQLENAPSEKESKVPVNPS